MAPYQHIEEDLRSLKEVVEMKNQQIHQQEQKISDLEKVVRSPPLTFFIQSSSSLSIVSPH